MAKYIFRRILMSIPVLFAIIVVTFALAYALPGGPFDASNQRRLPPHIRAQLEQKFGLNKPVFFNLPNDGKGSETAWGETVSVKGYSDTGFEVQRFDAPEQAGISLYQEYRLIDNGAQNCLGQRSEPGWALIARREECIVTGGDATQTLTESRTRWSVDLLDTQFWNYLGNILRLDFGPSLDLAQVQENRQVTDAIRERLPVSLQLGIFSTIVGFTLGIPLGVFAAIYHNSFWDYTATFTAVFLASIPGIVLAPMLIVIFAVKLRWLPAANGPIWKEGSLLLAPYVAALAFSLVFLLALSRLLAALKDARNGKAPRSLGQWGTLLLVLVIVLGAGYAALLTWGDALHDVENDLTVLDDYIQALILPVLTISTGMSAGIARLTRASVLQVLHEDYIQTARAKGLRERRVLYIHALKNALIPVVTSVGTLLAGIVSGSFIVELIFSIPGMGDIFIIAVGARDYTTIIGVTIFYSTVLILGNLLVDILYTWLDPRIRYD